MIWLLICWASRFSKEVRWRWSSLFQFVLFLFTVVASEYQTAYSSNAAENVVYTSDQTFNKQSITEERSGTSVTLTPETSNYRLVLEYLISSCYNSTKWTADIKTFSLYFLGLLYKHQLAKKVCFDTQNLIGFPLFFFQNDDDLCQLSSCFYEPLIVCAFK